MFRHAFGTIFFIAVAATFFSIPLILKYRVYTPAVDYLFRGDEVLFNERYPNFWCESQELSSYSAFNAFLFERTPGVEESAVRRTVTTAHMKLPNKAQEFWGFHLLKGTNVSIWSCVKLSGASITMVKGRHHLKRCMSQYSASLNSDEDSSEELSETESDDVTSSISSSQGVVSNETTIPYPCTTAIEHKILASDYRCNSAARRHRRKFLFTHHVTATDYYFLVFISDTYLDIIPNEFSVKLVMERTSYSKHSASMNCTMATSCDIPLSLGSTPKIVVEVPFDNGTLEEDEITTTCKPRKWIFFLFYLGFTIIFFFCAFQ